MDTESHLESHVINRFLDFFDSNSHTERNLDDIHTFLLFISLLTIQETEHDVRITDCVELVQLRFIRLARLVDIKDKLIESGVKSTQSFDDFSRFFVVGKICETFDIGVQHGNILEFIDDVVSVRISEEFLSGLGLLRKGKEWYVFGKKLGDQEFLFGVSLSGSAGNVVKVDFLDVVNVDMYEIEDQDNTEEEDVIDVEDVSDTPDDEEVDNHAES